VRTDEDPAMAVATMIPPDRPRGGALSGAQEVAASADVAFALICEVEKWPVWLSFLKSARRMDTGPLGTGSEIALRGAIPGEREELYEVEHYLPGHILALVGAYSLRRRIDFRVESKSATSRVLVRLDYPSYGGVLGALVDRMTARRRLEAALAESLVHFKGLVEFDSGKDALLEDF
jgi:uncharacterized membrane protein